MIFEVPWDSFWGPKGPISAPGGDRILPKVDFSHLRYEITCCTGGFFGQFFASQMGFQTCVAVPDGGYVAVLAGGGPC